MFVDSTDDIIANYDPLPMSRANGFPWSRKMDGIYGISHLKRNYDGLGWANSS